MLPPTMLCSDSHAATLARPRALASTLEPGKHASRSRRALNILCPHKSQCMIGVSVVRGVPVQKKSKEKKTKQNSWTAQKHDTSRHDACHTHRGSIMNSFPRSPDKSSNPASPILVASSSAAMAVTMASPPPSSSSSTATSSSLSLATLPVAEAPLPNASPAPTPTPAPLPAPVCAPLELAPMALPLTLLAVTLPSLP